jgi:U3 small nucleolar RNA-associated protein 10
MRRALEVSAALTHRASDPESNAGAEDASSRRALEEALSAIVPAWIEGGLGVDAACARVVDALPDAPDHRRAGLVSAFLKATDLCVKQHEVGGDVTNAETNETKKRMSSSTDRAMGLAIVARELLTRAESLEAAAEASARRRAAKAARRAAKEGGAAAAAALEAIEMEKARAIETASAWVGNLVATLLARETATAAVSALVRVAEVRQKTRRDATRRVIVFARKVVTRLTTRPDATRRDCARYSTPAASETSR